MLSLALLTSTSYGNPSGSVLDLCAMSLSLKTHSPHRFRPAAEPLLPCSYHGRGVLVLLLMCLVARCNGHLAVGAEKPWWNTMESLEGVEKYLDVARSHVGDK